jgi:hypothetical protein
VCSNGYGDEYFPPYVFPENPEKISRNLAQLLQVDGRLYEQFLAVVQVAAPGGEERVESSSGGGSLYTLPTALLI